MTLMIAEPILNAERATIHTDQPAYLGIIMVGNDPSSEQFVALKERTGKAYGVAVNLIRLPESSTTDEVRQSILALNNDTSIDGIIVQLPLPGNFDTESILKTIEPKKDVDKLMDLSKFESPMVLSVAALAKQFSIKFSGKKLCLVGHGRLIGQPLEAWLKKQGLETTIVNDETENSDYMLREADILFGGTGQRHVINNTNTREGQIIFDCSGVDVDFETIKEKCEAITPPKGSVGPLTVHYLLMNTILAAQTDNDQQNPQATM